MSLLVVTVRDSAYADIGINRISTDSNGINIFLFSNEPAVPNLLLPSITFGSHYIRNTWNARSSCFWTDNRWHAADVSACWLKRNAVHNFQYSMRRHLSAA